MTNELATLAAGYKLVHRVVLEMLECTGDGGQWIGASGGPHFDGEVLEMLEQLWIDCGGYWMQISSVECCSIGVAL
jgi:hypothetical protein